MPTDDSELRPGEVEITDQEERLWRQVHPVWVHDGRVTSQLFSPTPKDSGELSATRASVVSAEAAYHYHTQVMGNNSAGVYCVEIADVQEVGLKAIDDSQTEGAAHLPPGHAFIDFKGVQGKGRQRRSASALRDKAEKHGWQHGPTA